MVQVPVALPIKAILLVESSVCLGLSDVRKQKLHFVPLQRLKKDHVWHASQRKSSYLAAPMLSMVCEDWRLDGYE